MSFLTRNVIQPIAQWYSEINSATLTGAIDVLVVEQADGSLVSSPFHVRFGKLGVLKAREKIVDIEINEEPVDIHMKLDDAGAAFFVEDVSDSEEDEIPPELATSPIPDSDLLYSQAVKKSPETTPQPPASGKWKLQQQQQQQQQQPQVQQQRKKRKRRVNHRRGGSKSSLRDMGIVEREGSSESNSSVGSRGKNDNEGSSDIFQLEDNDNDGDLDDDDNETPTNSVKTSSSTPMHQTKPVIKPLSDIKPNKDLKHETSTGEQSFLESRLGGEAIESILETQEKIDKQQQSTPKVMKSTQYFSEPEMMSPEGSRPGTPVLSDTEYETKRQISEEQSWEWGKLPNTSSPSPSKGMIHKEHSDSKLDTRGQKGAQEEGDTRQRSWTFSFWKSKNESKRQTDGVYLDDLKGDDEEMMAIYLGRHASGLNQPEDDVESGNGPSLPMSPHSVEGAIGGGTARYESSDEEQRNHLVQKNLPDIAFSLCGGLEGPPKEGQAPFSNLIFEQSVLSFDDFVMRLRNKQDVFADPNLVVRIGEQYYTWQSACPMIMSAVLFGRTLPSDLVDYIRGSYQEIRTKESSPNSKSARTSSWWPFGRRMPNDEGTGESLAEKIAASMESTDARSEVTPTITEERGEESEKPDVGIEITPAVDLVAKDMPGMKITIPEDPLPEGERSLRGSSAEKSDTELSGRKYKKTLRLSSEALLKLNLRPGANEASFSVTTAYQGTSRCKCHIYKWKYTDKIVISDIDGTITKSDVLGHVLPIIGRDWAQNGVASLFSKIADNGYHIVYLSARAIGQATITKDYLASIRQGNIDLPDGPMFLNPTSLVNAFHREVIERKPEKFKIACLRDIQKLFPENRNPFYAGYGNRINDVFAYRTVGIPISRIFTINTRGELRHELSQTFQASYVSHCDEVDHYYPTMKRIQSLLAKKVKRSHKRIDEFLQVPPCTPISTSSIASGDLNDQSATVICFSRKYSSFDDTWSRPYERDLNPPNDVLDSAGETCIFDFDRSDSDTGDQLEEKEEAENEDVEDDLLDRFDSVSPDVNGNGGEDSESVYADAFSREASSVRLSELDS
ncbi:phosphatidate phosphatase LPIN3-like isoform X1 [Tigriopus californicus]|uniref:phosphatidate phosphatase LPIN3-like isoform X1 n=1 Tax=Tigriopus californicus TaxID=6832 RepID=UPI0027DA0D68|nr:phosphatidate phosphatase LPIN3-like isoform X1 [Tigriopus californicus]XP_059086495.1 phosphatidate phosphatase LPIN3-like isoform X1 [Tigriopus californicus]XP_059086496.1 phosphatidate phosphatase LPIN3-like isoform X1 [Tigriopus californicus]XP_059086497.1 phosphatidate phosphatase LPIN3-like isoform X1 [Tigriopus californicus]XP_059086498.1 phosphatidate phosphatase LPIN3-like isoform X1 [Tigriopus californicus]